MESEKRVRDHSWIWERLSMEEGAVCAHPTSLLQPRHHTIIWYTRVLGFACNLKSTSQFHWDDVTFVSDHLSTEYSAKMWLRQQGVITISHISKRLEEKVSRLVPRLRDLLHLLCSSLGFPLIAARCLLQRQASLLTELHPIAEMKRKGVLCITPLLSWREIFPKNPLVGFHPIPLSTIGSHPRPYMLSRLGKRVSGFFQPFLREANSASK